MSVTTPQPEYDPASERTCRHCGHAVAHNRGDENQCAVALCPYDEDDRLLAENSRLDAISIALHVTAFNDAAVYLLKEPKALRDMADVFSGQAFEDPSPQTRRDLHERYVKLFTYYRNDSITRAWSESRQKWLRSQTARAQGRR